MNDYDEPLATRRGMLSEVLQSCAHYPFVFVVVWNDVDVPTLQQALLELAHCEGVILGDKVSLPRSTIRFGPIREAEAFRGTVPVFTDPQQLRRAA